MGLETKYLYFNKTTFRHLINLWLRLDCDKTDWGLKFLTKDEYINWLMGAFIPDKFIDDIEQSLLRGRK